MRKARLERTEVASSKLRGRLVAAPGSPATLSGLAGPRLPHHDSQLSVNTVVENPAFAREHHTEEDTDGGEDEDGLDDDEGEFHPLRRTGSYTLEEPSPLLKAYLDKYGDGDMSLTATPVKFGRSELTTSNEGTADLLLFDDPPRQSKEEMDRALQTFLADIGRAPSVDKSAVEQARGDSIDPLSEKSAQCVEDGQRPQTVCDNEEFSVASSARYSVALPLLLHQESKAEEETPRETRDEIITPCTVDDLVDIEQHRTESQLTVTARDPKPPPVPSSHVDIGTDLASLALTHSPK